MCLVSHCSTVNDVREVSAVSVSKAFSTPNLFASSANFEAELKSSKLVEVCLPWRRYRTA